MPPEPHPAADLDRRTGRHADTLDSERPSLPGQLRPPAATPAGGFPGDPWQQFEHVEHPGRHPEGARPAPTTRRGRRAALAVDHDAEATALLPRATVTVEPLTEPFPERFAEPLTSPTVTWLDDDDVPVGQAAPMAEVGPGTPVRRTPPSGLRRKDIRLASKAATIIRRDKRRQWFAGATILVVLVTIIIPSMIMNGSAQAQGVSSGRMLLKPGGSAWADSAVKLTDGTGAATFEIPARPLGASLYLAVELRASAKSAYRAKVRVYPDGALNVGLSSVIGGKERSLGNRRLGAKIAATGSALKLQGLVSKSNPTKVGVRAWVDGAERPAWQLTLNDTKGGVGTGTVRAWAYLSGGAAAPLTVDFHHLSGEDRNGKPITAPPTMTAGPVPSATITPTYSPSGTATSVTSTTKPSATKPTATSTGGGGGSSKPGASGTGVPAGTDLKVHNGDLVVTRSGATYEGLDIRGFVDIKASNVTIKNSLIRGGKATGNRGVLNVTNESVRNFVLEDSEIRPANPSVLLDGVNGGNFTLRRVEIDGGVDTAKIFRDNARIESSWLHGADKFASDPNHNGGPTHNDGVQVQGGRNVVIKGTRIEGADNAAIMVTQDFAATTNLTISGNFLSGGGCTVNIVPSDLPSVGPVKLTDNEFARNSRVDDCAVARTASTQLTASGNTYVGGAPATINVWN